MNDDIRTFAVIVMLAVNSAVDVKKREILPLFTIAAAVFGVAFRLLTAGSSLQDLVFALLPGGFLMAVSLATKGSVGLGDALAVLAAGVWEDAWQAWAMLMVSLLFSSVAALIFLAVKRRNGSLPFVPFVLAGYLASLGFFGL